MVFSLLINVELLHLTLMFLNCGRMLEYKDKTPLRYEKNTHFHTERLQPRFEPGTVLQWQCSLEKRFRLFTWSTSISHIGKQLLWKKCLTFSFMNNWGMKRKCHCLIQLTTIFPEEKMPWEAMSRKTFVSVHVCVCVWVCMWYGSLYSQFLFELSCTINSHQAGTVNLWDWRQ